MPYDVIDVRAGAAVRLAAPGPWREGIMRILERWEFATLDGSPERSEYEEFVAIEHPATGAAMLVMVPGNDRLRAMVSLKDPAHDVLIVTAGTMTGFTVRLAETEVQSGPHCSHRVTFVPAGTPFALHHQRDSTMLVALILPAGRLAASPAAVSAPFALREDHGLAMLVHDIGRLIMRMSDEDCAVIAQQTAVIAAALAAPRTESPQVAAERLSLSPFKLRGVLAFIDDNLHRPLTLKEMAEHVNLSPYHFARMFKHATGRSPYDHLRWRRIVRSTALVARSELKIAEISAMTGFASAAHFSQAFQREAGVSPMQFRKVVRPRLLKVPLAEGSGELRKQNAN